MKNLFNLLASAGIIVLFMNIFHFLYVNTLLIDYVDTNVYHWVAFVVSCGLALRTYIQYIKEASEEINKEFVLK